MSKSPIDRVIHSTFINRIGPQEDDAVIAKIHRHHPDGKVEPMLKVLRNPRRRFYTTKPGLRDQYNEKKEWEEMHMLDEHVCLNKDLPKEVFNALHGFYPTQRPPNMRKLSESPYLYGADISIEALIKSAHNKRFDASKASPAPLTTGMFDVETNVLTDGFGRLIMATISHENQIYTSVLKASFFKLDKAGNKKPGDLAELEKLAYFHLDAQKVFPSKRAQKALNGRKFKLNFHIANEPIDILRWTLSKMHENRTDFMGVWNLPFDMGVILRTCKEAGVDPASVLCPPDLPKEYRNVHFAIDQGKKEDHFTRRWHWLYAPGYTKWYDAMCLYSILRIVAGFETSYALDNVLKVNDVCDGKLKFKNKIPYSDEMSGIDWHRMMQSKHPYEYIIYNIFDVMSVQVMEWINNDVPGMHVLIGDSVLQNFTKQTRRSADVLYFKCLERNMVTAVTSPATIKDDDIVKQGGAVLTPERTWKAGINIILEAPQRESYVHGNVNDIDLSALYPSITMACNISRETKTGTMIRIENHPDQDVRTLASMLISLQENAVPISQKFFGLPGYEDMGNLFDDHLKKAAG